MKVWVLTISLLALAAVEARAQASIVINESPRVAELYNLFIRYNRSHTKLPGWRVQILATTDRRLMEETRQRFLLAYPDIPTTYEHTKPYYKLRAGAFESKAEADKLKDILSSEYDGLYLVRDEINLRELLDMYR